MKDGDVMNAQVQPAADMELLQRYLHEVKRYLPKAQQDDIIAEMSDTLQSQIEDKQGELGRPLTRDEESAIIKAYGHPKIVASRYRSWQYLIGPQLLPFYIYTLKIVLVTLAILDLVGFAVQGFTSGDLLSTIGLTWAYFWGSLFGAIGVVTVVFAAIQFSQSKFGDPLSQIGVTKWDPRALPRVQAHIVPRGGSITELIFNVIILAWLLDAPMARHLVGFMFLGPAAAYFTANPFELTAWIPQLILAVIVVVSVHILMNCINIVRPDWVKLRAAVLTATGSLMVLVLAFILRSHTFITVAHSVRKAGDYQDAAAALNTIIFVGLWIYGAVLCLTIIMNLRRLLQRDKQNLIAA